MSEHTARTSSHRRMTRQEFVAGMIIVEHVDFVIIYNSTLIRTLDDPKPALPLVYPSSAHDIPP